MTAQEQRAASHSLSTSSSDTQLEKQESNLNVQNMKDSKEGSLNGSATSEQQQPPPAMEYPSGFRLAVTFFALVVSMFLLSLDLVSTTISSLSLRAIF